MLGDRLGIEDQAHQLRLPGGVLARQHQVVDLRLDLIPHPTGDFHVAAQELLQRRGGRTGHVEFSVHGRREWQVASGKWRVKTGRKIRGEWREETGPDCLYTRHLPLATCHYSSLIGCEPVTEELVVDR